MKIKRVNAIFFFLVVIFSLCIISSAPILVLNSPEDGNVSSSSSINFNCTVSDAISLTNVTLEINGVLNETNFSGINNTYYLFEKNFADGNYAWTCVATNNQSEETSISGMDFVVNTIGPSYSSNSTNSTLPGQAIMHRLYVQDASILSGYIFSFDNGNGIFENDSWQSFSGTGSWANITKVANSSNGAIIKWKVYANDSYNKMSVSTEYSYTISSLSSISVSLTSPSNGAGFHNSNVAFNCSSTDNVALLNATLYGNWSGGWHANQTISLSGLSDSAGFMKNITTKAYAWNCYVCDSLNNCSFASNNRTFLIDTRDPVVKLVNPIDDAVAAEGSFIFKFNVTDDIGIKNCTLYVDGDIEGTKTSVSNNTNISFSSISLAGSSSGLDYRWYVECYDYGGNYDNTSSFTLTVSEENSEIIALTTTEQAAEDYWTSTYSPSAAEFSDGYTRELTEKSRLKVVVESSDHYVGIVDLNSTAVTINVSSTTQQAILNVGDEKKFGVTADGYYNLYVKLNSITGLKANLTVRTINEKIPLGEKGYIAPLALNNNESEDLTESEKNVATFKAERIWIIIISSIVVLLLLFAIYLYKRRKQFGF